MKETCANCGGTGFIRCEHCGGRKREPDSSVLDEDCRKCAGMGKAPCPQCDGTGFLREEIHDYPMHNTEAASIPLPLAETAIES
jgi:hypothetical protein